MSTPPLIVIIEHRWACSPPADVKLTHPIDPPPAHWPHGASLALRFTHDH